MEKSLEQLKQEYEKTTVLLEQEKRKMQRLKNRQAYLESGSRKQRTHRLITRGAAIESIAPQTKELSEAEFYSLILRIKNPPNVPKSSVLSAVMLSLKSHLPESAAVSVLFALSVGHASRLLPICASPVKASFHFPS